MIGVVHAQRARARALVAASLAVLPAAAARAAEGDPPSGVSTCFDADSLWHSAGASRFAGLSSPAVPNPGSLAFAALLSYVDRPVLLSAPSPDPEGRDVNVVRDRVDLSLAYSYGLGAGLELSVATPVVLHQTGSGAEGITSQRAPPLTSVAVRDPRIGGAIRLLRTEGEHGWDAKLKLELGLPLGDDQLYAGAGAFTFAPGFASGLRWGPLHGAVELGARLRRAVPFATAKIGSQAFAGVGVGVDVIGERLSLELEASALPSLVSQPGRTRSASRVSGGRLVPAEWLASLRSAPVADAGVSFSLGGGTGLPLSSETRETASASSTERFAGVTTPRFRLFFGLRYQPEL